MFQSKEESLNGFWEKVSHSIVVSQGHVIQTILFDLFRAWCKKEQANDLVNYVEFLQFINPRMEELGYVCDITVYTNGNRGDVHWLPNEFSDVVEGYEPRINVPFVTKAYVNEKNFHQGLMYLTDISFDTFVRWNKDYDPIYVRAVVDSAKKDYKLMEDLIYEATLARFNKEEK